MQVLVRSFRRVEIHRGGHDDGRLRLARVFPRLPEFPLRQECCGCGRVERGPVGVLPLLGGRLVRQVELEVRGEEVQDEGVGVGRELRAENRILI